MDNKEKRTKYVALLRGIAPMNPNMRNEKLRGVFETLGFRNVQTVISSGNVLFESPSQDIKALEAAVEEALPAQLGFTSTTIIRSLEELEQLVRHNPFASTATTPNNYLTVTFLKEAPNSRLSYPFQPEGKTYTLLNMYDRAICSVTDLSGNRAPDLMSWLERKFGKEITTRTWQTVGRIIKRLSN